MNQTRSWLRSWRFVLLMVILFASGALAATLAIRTRTAVPGWSDRTAPREPQHIPLSVIKSRFSNAPSGLQREDYLMLARHLLEGWSLYRTPDGARAHYPGLPSVAGRPADGLEGFARILPLAAVMLVRGEDPEMQPGLRLSQALREGLIRGTQAQDTAAWGEIRPYSPQYVEAADIALGLWIAREFLWEPLSLEHRAQVVQWFSGAMKHVPYDGNWTLFPLLVHRSLRALGVDVSRFDARMQTHWERLMHLYQGRGWFHDPPHGFDYYNAWGIHNSLYWLRRIEPDFGGDFVPQAQGDFAGFLRHLIGPRGHPPIGRSTCYRMALPAPLLGSLHVAPGAISAGQALRALDLTWGWFVEHGALSAGAITAGLCRADAALQPQYSGPASCLWSTRSLVIALDLDHRTGLLDGVREPLPVESQPFLLRHPVTGWVVRGEPASGRIALYPHDLGPDGAPSDDEPALREPTPLARLQEWLLQRPKRPDNLPALYRRTRYSTDDDIARRCEPGP
jgi:hypothetical protein